MESNIIDFLKQNYSQEALNTVTLLTGGGSSRKYYRFWDQNQSFILAESYNIDENKTFIHFTNQLKSLGINVPTIYKVNTNSTLYVQSDLGDLTLLDALKKDPFHTKSIYFKVIDQLVEAQIKAAKTIDFNHTFSYPKLDKTLVLRDLFQFKFYFLNTLGIEFNQGKLIKDFDLFASQFDQLSPKGFIFRDFQSRNIMVKNDQPYFIDYQGGLFGPIFYDLVSLIWQAKANLPIKFKKELYAHYEQQLKKIDPNAITIDNRTSYEYCVVARLLQVLGAYGLRGLIEKKSHFIESISYGIENLKAIIDYPILQNYPELKHVIKTLIEPHSIELINQKING